MPEVHMDEIRPNNGANQLSCQQTLTKTGSYPQYLCACTDPNNVTVSKPMKSFNDHCPPPKTLDRPYCRIRDLNCECKDAVSGPIYCVSRHSQKKNWCYHDSSGAKWIWNSKLGIEKWKNVSIVPVFYGGFMWNGDINLCNNFGWKANFRLGAVKVWKSRQNDIFEFIWKLIFPNKQDVFGFTFSNFTLVDFY